MKRVLVALLLAITFGTAPFTSQAADKTITHGQFIDKFVLSNTTGGQWDGYICIALAGQEHKIACQPSPTNHTTETAFCNNTNEEDRECNPYSPDPLYEEWDEAFQIDFGDQLTPANRRKWLHMWAYEMDLKKPMKQVTVFLKTQSGYTANKQRNTLSGSYQFLGLTPANADACAATAINTMDVCTYSETGEVHLPLWIKRMTEDLFGAVIDLP